MQLGRATYGGGRSGDGDSGLFTRVLYKSYLILLLKIGGELYTWDSVRFGFYIREAVTSRNSTKYHQIILQIPGISTRVAIWDITYIGSVLL